MMMADCAQVEGFFLQVIRWHHSCHTIFNPINIKRVVVSGVNESRLHCLVAQMLSGMSTRATPFVLYLPIPYPSMNEAEAPQTQFFLPW